MEQLRNRHNSLINKTTLEFKRSIMSSLPWNERLIGIKGSRGIGKTTLLLQYIKENYNLSPKAIYISLDNLYFSDNSLIDFVDEFVTKGGEHLFIDEVHKYANWAIEIKNCYDFHSNLKIVFTGSSLLEILNSRADLSRRALVYKMQGLSFREFLSLKYSITFDQISLEEILKNHNEISINISNEIKPLQYFEEYLKVGYFPFYNGNELIYYQRLQEVINMTLEIELPLLRKTDISIVSKMKQLLYIISNSVPFKPNISSLANKIKTTRKTILDYLNYLHEAEILTILHKNTVGISLLQKPEKLYVNNSNYMYAILGTQPNIGTIREIFFLNQVSANHSITYPEKGDFFIDNKYTFEIGGKNKTSKQLQDISNSYLVKDNIEFGFENKIPLWLFGFLY